MSRNKKRKNTSRQQISNLGLSLVIYPDDILKQKSNQVTEFDKDLRTIVRGMFDIVRQSSVGVGLAAVQVGILKNIIVVSCLAYNGSMINAGILDSSEEYDEVIEGCLSHPGVQVKVKRANRILVKYQNIDGGYETLMLQNFPARIVQHELDHVHGINIIDKGPIMREFKNV